MWNHYVSSEEDLKGLAEEEINCLFPLFDMFFSFCFCRNNHEWNFRIRTMMHEKASYLKMCGCVDGHRHFPFPSLEAVVCVTVAIDNPFRSTWRLMWRNNSHGTVSLPFKIEMHSSAEFTSVSVQEIGKTNIWIAILAHMLGFDIFTSLTKPAHRFHFSDGGMARISGLLLVKDLQRRDDWQAALSYMSETMYYLLGFCFVCAI